MKRKSQFWHLKFADDYDRTKETFLGIIDQLKENPATEYPNSFKNRWDEIVSITSANVAQNEYKWTNGRYRGSV